MRTPLLVAILVLALSAVGCGPAENGEVPDAAQQIFDLFRQNPNAQAQLRAPIFEDKVVDLIVSKAKVEDEKVSKEDLLKDDELPEGYGE